MRPQLHFTPRQHWMNDPNGLIYYQGNYHIFYQHFPYENHWGTMHWGHATTKDFVHFTHHPIALYPSKPYDQNGCFSGSAIIYNDQLYLYYTAIRYNSLNENNIHLRNHENDTSAKQAMMISRDGFHFDNHKDKQIIIDEYPQSRDPKAFMTKKGNLYLMIGSEENNISTLLFYESKDGTHFTYKNKFQHPTLGDMWECPNIFEIDSQYFLMVCPENIDMPPRPNCNAVILPINFDEATCEITNVKHHQYLDVGLDFYAPQSFLDENNQLTILGWMRMRQVPKGENWVGMLSFPRVLSQKNGHIYQQPHPYLQQQFTKETESIDLTHPFELAISLQEGDYINLGNFMLSIENDCLISDRTLVSIHHPKVCNINKTPKLNQRYDLVIYYDFHIFEIYINDGAYVLSQIVYDLDFEKIHCPYHFTCKQK